MSRTMVHNLSGDEKVIPTGFSWTMLLFGIFVPLFRGYWAYFFILLALCFVGGLGVVVAWLICPFLINKHYYEHLLKSGWVPAEKYKPA